MDIDRDPARVADSLGPAEAWPLGPLGPDHTIAARAQLSVARGETISGGTRHTLLEQLNAWRTIEPVARKRLTDADFSAGGIAASEAAFRRHAEITRSIREIEQLLQACPDGPTPQLCGAMARRDIPLTIRSRARSSCGGRRRPGVRRVARACTGPPGSDDGSGELDPPGGDSAGNEAFAADHGVVA